MVSRRRISLAVLLLAIAALVVLLSSQHRIRLIAGSFSILDSAGEASWPPGVNSAQQFMPAQTTSRHRFDDAVQIATAFLRAYPTKLGDPLPTIDDPDSCELFLEQGRPLHCYNVDIGLSKILAAHGVYSRMWDLCGANKLGGFGHNLLEVWDDSARSWKAFDPYYHCYFTLGPDSTPISLGTLRAALLHPSGQVNVKWYYHSKWDRPASEILSEYRFLAPGALLHANNNFRTRYRTRYGFLMPFASSFDKLPLRYSRAIRTVMLGSSDTRYVIQDAYSPHYPIVSVKVLFYALLVLILVSIVTIFQTPKRIKRKTSVLRQPEEHPDFRLLGPLSQSRSSIRRQ